MMREPSPTSSHRIAFLAGQVAHGVLAGALLAVALWRLLALSGSIPVFRYLMF